MAVDLDVCDIEGESQIFGIYFNVYDANISEHLMSMPCKRTQLRNYASILKLY